MLSRVIIRQANKTNYGSLPEAVMADFRMMVISPIGIYSALAESYVGKVVHWSLS